MHYLHGLYKIGYEFRCQKPRTPLQTKAMASNKPLFHSDTLVHVLRYVLPPIATNISIHLVQVISQSQEVHTDLVFSFFITKNSIILTDNIMVLVLAIKLDIVLVD